MKDHLMMKRAFMPQLKPNTKHITLLTPKQMHMPKDKPQLKPNHNHIPLLKSQPHPTVKAQTEAHAQGQAPMEA